MMTERQPVAYVRRSFSRRHDPGDVSREFQTAEVRRLAGEDAGNLIVKSRDWGVSASREHIERRLDFLDMIEMVKRGEVSTVYAYSADRLARSVQWSARLIDACEDAGTTIVTGEGRYAPDDDSAKMMFGFLALQNEAALRQMKKKTQASFAVRKARGDHLGPAPYGSKVVAGKLVDNPDERLDVLIDAYRRAGTLQGAARLLNAEQVPTRTGKPWRATTLRGILDRANVLPRRLPRGRTPSRSYLLAKLLRCPCGATLTGRLNTKGRRGYAYECKQAASKPGHGPYSISEARLIRVIQTEAAMLRSPHDRIAEVSAGDDIEALDRRRGALIDLYLDDPNPQTKALLDERLAKIDDDQERLAGRLEAIVVDVPTAIDWTQPVAIVNEILRAMWERIELGPDLMPKPDGFVWRREEWRA
jgi:DNA invertase Pin-like site-specific DNA recombinase